MGPKTDPRTPAISLDLIRTRLLLKTKPREARAIICRLADYETPSRNAQILALLSIIRDGLGYNWSYREIGTIFNVNKGTVHRIRSDAIKDFEHGIGRPLSYSRRKKRMSWPTLLIVFSAVHQCTRNKSAPMSLMRSGNRFRRHGHGGLSTVMRKRSNAPQHIPRRILAWKYRERLREFTSEI
jgi:hypothetical protein